MTLVFWYWTGACYGGWLSSSSSSISIAPITVRPCVHYTVHS